LRQPIETLLDEDRSHSGQGGLPSGAYPSMVPGGLICLAV